MENDADQQPVQQDNPETQPPPAQQQPQPPHHETRRERRRRKKLVMFLSGGAVLALLLAGGAYWFLTRDNTESTQPLANTEEQKEDETAAATPDPTPVTYKSDELNIELTHRKDWSIKESGDGEITVTSPSTSYVRTDGETKIGVFTVKIRIGVPSAVKTTIEKAVAPRDSEVIAYDEPTEEQRQYTNLSYAGQEEVFNFFIVTGNTELKAGTPYSYSLPLDGGFYLIVGGYGEDKDGTLSFDSIPADSMDSATLQQGLDIVKSLKIY